MNIVVDMETCICSGMCTTIAPDLFELDDAGRLVVLRPGDLSDADREAAEHAIACCPVEAIRLAADRVEA